MKALLLIIILFSCSSSLLFTQGNETEKQLVSTPVKGELGVVLGTPAGANVIASTHFDTMLLKGSLGYFGSGNIGYQLELGYKFSELTNTYQAVSVGIGYFDHDTFEYNSFSYGKVRSANRWQYASVNYIVNSKGFYFSAGLSAGTGTMSNPLLLLQMGYAYRFR